MIMDSTKELIFQDEIIAQMIEAGFVEKPTATIANVRCIRRMR